MTSNQLIQLPTGDHIDPHYVMMVEAAGPIPAAGGLAGVPARVTLHLASNDKRVIDVADAATAAAIRDEIAGAVNEARQGDDSAFD